MRCRAWETRHKNGKTYIHVVAEELEAIYVKDLAERLAGSPIEGELIGRDVVGSYLVANEGNESISFSSFVPLDSHVLDDVALVKEGLEVLVKGNVLQAKALKALFERLGMVEET